MTAGLYGAIGVMAALRNVEVSGGCGQVVDVPLLDPLIAILGPQAANYRLTGTVKQRSRQPFFEQRSSQCLSHPRQPMALPLRIHAGDGRTSVSSDRSRRSNYGSTVSDQSLRLENVESLDTIIADFVAEKTQAECLNFFENASTTVGPIYDMRDIELDPHFHEEYCCGTSGSGNGFDTCTHHLPSSCEHPGVFRNAAPEIGEHTLEVMGELGYTDSAIAELRESGTIKLWMPTDSEGALEGGE